MSLTPKRREKQRGARPLSKREERRADIESASMYLDEGAKAIRKIKRYKGAANREVLNPYLDDLEKSMTEIRKEINRPTATSMSVQKAWDKFYYFDTIDSRQWHIGAGKNKAARTRSRRRISDMIDKATRKQIVAQYYYKNHFKHVKTDHYKTMKDHRRSDGYVYGDKAVQLNTSHDYVWMTSGWIAPQSKRSKVRGWNSNPTIYHLERVIKVRSWYKTRDEASKAADRLKAADKRALIARTDSSVPWRGFYLFEVKQK